MRALHITAAIAVAGLAIWGAIELNQYRKCVGYEDDFLNGFETTKSALSLQSLAPSDEGRKIAGELLEIGREKSDKAIENLVYECGSRAADNAIRKARESII